MQEKLDGETTGNATRRHKTRRGLSNEQAQRWQGERPWPVKALTWLLVLEGLLLGLGAYFNLPDGETLFATVIEHPFYAAYIPLSGLALIAAIGFLQLRPGAWVIAMLAQGLLLLTALIRYFGGASRDWELYVMLVYGVFMVLYLNYAEVPLVFRVQPGIDVTEEEGEVIR
jgi:hypothetical protein